MQTDLSLERPSDGKGTSPQVQPVVAWISNSMTPYREHFFDRILREIPQIKLITGFTHGSPSAPWNQVYADRFCPAVFHQGEPVVTSYCPNNLLRDWKKGRAIISWLKRTAPKAVVFGGYNDPGLIRSMNWCTRNRLPFYLFADSNIFCDTVSGWKRRMKRLLIHQIVKRAAGIFVCGSVGVEYYRHYGADDKKLFIVPYESNFDLFRSPAKSDVKDVAGTYSISDCKRRRIVFCGRLVEVKRVDLLIDAFVKIQEARPQWDLVIIGDGPLRSELERRIPQELQHRIIWTGFLDDPAKIGAICNNCDVLALPSSMEPWGIVVSEAVAARLAVVVSDVVGSGFELVKNDVNGFRFKNGDLDSLTDALTSLTTESEIDRYRNASLSVFAEWHRTSDPITGLRKALKSSGVLAEHNCHA